MKKRAFFAFAALGALFLGCSGDGDGARKVYVAGITFTNIDDAAETARVFQYGGTGEYYLETTIGTETSFALPPSWSALNLLIDGGNGATKKFVNDAYRDPAKLVGDTAIPGSKYFTRTGYPAERYWLVASGGKIAWAYTLDGTTVHAGTLSYFDFIAVEGNFVH